VEKDPGNLLDKLKETSAFSRLNAVDAAYIGNPYAGSNFKAKFQGYNEDGMSIIKYQDQLYTAKNLSGQAAERNKTVFLRAAKGIRTVNY
jgi:hypothetical protein